MTTRRIKFNGFATGSSVSIAAALGGDSDSGSASTWGQSASADIAILRRNPGKFAPDGVFFEVTNLSGFDTAATHAPTGNVYEPQFHDIEVFWDFGDPGTTYSAPVNTLAEHKDRNVAKGHQAAHVYRSAGDYTVTAFLVEVSSGKTATATLTLSEAATNGGAVVDPDTYFAGNKTIFIGTAGNAANIPTGAVELASYDAMRTTYGNLRPNRGHDFDFPSGADTRVMFADGHVETLTSNIFIETGDVGVFVCAEPGAATKPDLTVSDGTLTNNYNDRQLFLIEPTATDPNQFVMMQGIKVSGPWDSRLENDIGLANPHLFTVSTDGAEVYIFSDNLTTRGLIDGLGGGSGAQLDNIELTAFHHDADVSNWGNFGYYGSGFRWVAFLGCKITQNIQALKGGGKFDPQRFNNHGPIRINGDKNIVIDGCDLFSNTGWSGTPNVPQPCLRINTGGRIGAKYNVSRCAMEGGFDVIGLTHLDEVVPSDSAHNVVIDSNVLTIGVRAKSFIQDRFGGSTYRNNLLNHPDANLPNVFIRAINFEATAASGSVSWSSPIKIYNNTWINQLSAANDTADGFGDGDRELWGFGGAHNVGGWDGIMTIENNLVHQPNAALPQTTYTPISTTPLFQHRTTGYRTRWNEYTVTLGSAIAAGSSDEVAFPAGTTAGDHADDDSWCWLSASVVYRDGTTGLAVSVEAGGVRLTNNTGSEIAADTDVNIVLDQYGNNVANHLVEFSGVLPADSIWDGKPVNDPGGLGVSTAIEGWVPGEKRSAAGIGDCPGDTTELAAIPDDWVGAWRSSA